MCNKFQVHIPHPQPGKTPEIYSPHFQCRLQNEGYSLQNNIVNIVGILKKLSDLIRDGTIAKVVTEYSHVPNFTLLLLSVQFHPLSAGLVK